jgi:hypothetical protein
MRHDHKIEVSAYLLKNLSDPIEKIGPASCPRDLEKVFEFVPIDQHSRSWNAILSQSHSNEGSCRCNQILKRSQRGLIAGFFFKHGLDQVRPGSSRPYNHETMSLNSELRLFRKRLSAHFPALPIQEEGRLNQAQQRRLFLKRMFAGARIQAFFQQGWSIVKLLDFHKREKDMLRVRNAKVYRDIETLLSRILIYPLEQVERQYRELFIRASLA